MTPVAELNQLENLLKNADIIVLNTKSDRAMYLLAHVLRNYARTTFCIDKEYNILENSSGVRKIENGKTYLLKGDFEKEKELLLGKIKSLGGKPVYIFGGEKNG